MQKNIIFLQLLIAEQRSHRQYDLLMEPYFCDQKQVDKSKQSKMCKLKAILSDEFLSTK